MTLRARNGAPSPVSRGRDGGDRRDLPWSQFDGRREAIHSRKKVRVSRWLKSRGGVASEWKRSESNGGQTKQARNWRACPGIARLLPPRPAAASVAAEQSPSVQKVPASPKKLL